MKSLCTVLFLLAAAAVLPASPPQAPRPPQAPPLLITVERNCGCGSFECDCGSACNCQTGVGRCCHDCPCEPKRVPPPPKPRRPYARDICIEHGCQCGCLEGGPCTCSSKSQAVTPVQYSQPAPVFFWDAVPACLDCQAQQPVYQQYAWPQQTQQTYQPQSWSYPRQYSGGFQTSFSRGFTGGFARGGGGGRSC